MTKVWIADNWIDSTLWRLIGVFTTEAIAVDSCFDNYCFVAEIPVNADLKSGVFENQYYPLRNKVARKAAR